VTTDEVLRMAALLVCLFLSAVLFVGIVR